MANHVLAGALVGLAAPAPISAFVAGVASHVALDVVPHWGARPIEEILPIAVADGLLGLTAIAVVARRTPKGKGLRVLAGMAGGSIPDLDKPGVVFFGRSPFPPAVDDWHGRIQTESPDRMPQELLVGLVLSAVVAAVLRRLTRSAAGLAT